MTTSLPLVTLGRSELRATRVCLGTMTFGEQVDEPTSHAILDRALERGVNFIDTAEMYSVPVRRETSGASERILGNWFAARPGVRDRVLTEQGDVREHAAIAEAIVSGQANSASALMLDHIESVKKRFSPTLQAIAG